MESILVVSPDEWITEAVQRLDKTRFSVAVSDYDSALDTCLEASPSKVLIGAANDMGRAASLVGSLVRLQAPRPAVILVGRPEQSSTFAKHASLRRRADGYVQEDVPPDQLVRALETTVPSEERRGRVRWNPYVVVALGAIIVAAPALESSGLVYAARMVSGGGAALGAWAEVARRRRGEPRGLLLLVGFLIVFALNAVMLAVRVLR